MKRLLTPLTLLLGAALLVGAVLFYLYAGRLEEEIRVRFEGKRWSLPATVYARPLELFVGQQLSPSLLEDELLLSGYRKGETVAGQGSFSRSGDRVTLISRAFHHPSGPEPPLHLEVRFTNEQILALTDSRDRSDLPIARLDPARIGSFHPTAHQDRIVLESEEVPALLTDTLLTVEDRHFHKHHGIAPLAILRALIANLRAGETVQGGSTITQQLVKNLFLSPERTLARKGKEAIMAMILDWHYSKQDILTTYINEVYLGQDGNRAIHGFALAGQHYFQRNLDDLTPAQIATLVGMVKGPSLYNPRRNPDNCRQRRQLVLAVMGESGLIDQATFQAARAEPLLDLPGRKGGFNRFPAFLDLVRQQLAAEYQEADLRSDGLQILTTLDPRVQFQVEAELKKSISHLELQGATENLEGAVIVTNRDNGEVLGLAGGRAAVENTFNRALQARRPIGSLVKPAVYLCALEHGYTLASPLDDSALSLTGEDGRSWRPRNYDRQEHGIIPLYAALAHSYNLATVRLGMTLGLEPVIATLQRMGVTGEISPFPSLLLGAIEMTPFEVAQFYQTLAADGFHTPLRAINAVMAADRTTLSRYGWLVEQRFAPEIIFQLNHALQRVMSEGTGKAILDSPLGSHHPAGKTGTTDELRDSWFAGFSGEHLAVVWLGRDDNRPIALTGSSGALVVWINTLEAIHSTPLALTEPAGISWGRIQARAHQSGSLLAGLNDTLLPFTAAGEVEQPPPSATGQRPAVRSRPPGSGSFFERLQNWLQ